MTKVEPRLVKGFRDGLASETLLRNRIVAQVRAVYERHGFAPLETPGVEHLDVLLGPYGEESGKQIFRFETGDGEVVALRFDLTVPLARVVAQYPDLPRPFRRYQVAPVWRGDKPGPGRFREFVQFDIDIVGASSTAADVEIVATAMAAFRAIGLATVVMRLSSRKLLNALLAYAAVPEARASEVFRVLDKLDKQGLPAVKLELTVGRTDASGDRIPGLGLGDEAVTRIERFLTLPRAGRGATLAAVANLFGDTTGASEALAELREIDAQLVALGLGDDQVQIDPTLARGLDYYTGAVFEAVLPEAPEFGSIFGGGRYDGLVERFLGTPIPATGGSLGVDRLIAALVHKGLATSRPTTTDVLIVNFDAALLAEYQRMAGELRSAGIATEVYLGDARGLKKQLAYADKLQIPLAVLVGGDEHARGEVSIKDLRAGTREMRDDDVSAAVRGTIEQVLGGSDVRAAVAALLERIGARPATVDPVPPVFRDLVTRAGAGGEAKRVAELLTSADRERHLARRAGQARFPRAELTTRIQTLLRES